MVSYPVDISNFNCDEQTKHIIRMAREMNESSLLQDNSPFFHEGVRDYLHICPYKNVHTPRNSGEYAQQQYWLISLQNILYCGVARNYAWSNCRSCNPKGLNAEQVVKQIAAGKILRYLRRKVPVLKFKRSTVVFANLHIRRGLPADVVQKCLSH